MKKTYHKQLEDLINEPSEHLIKDEDYLIEDKNYLKMKPHIIKRLIIHNLKYFIYLFLFSYFLYCIIKIVKGD